MASYEGLECQCDTPAFNETAMNCFCKFVEKDTDFTFHLIMISIIFSILICCCYCGCTLAFPECGYPCQCCCEAFQSFYHCFISCFERKIQCKVQDTNI